MATLNPQTNNSNVDSDNDTQMSTQDNDNTNNTNNQAANNNDNDNNQTNNPTINIDNAAIANDNNTNNNDSNMDDTTNNNDLNTNNTKNNNDDDAKMDDNTNNNDNSDTKVTKANDNDDNKVPNDTNNDNNNNKSGGGGGAQGQYKYTWQWLENDGSWHDYDVTTQLLLDQLAIGQKIIIQAGKWTYDITKISNDSCTQLNTQTHNLRTSRRAKVLLVPPSAPTSTSTSAVIYTQHGSNNWLGTGRYVFLWQFLENDNKWKDLGFNIAIKLDSLQLNGSVKYSFGKWTYTVNKITMDECTQTNDNTSNQRDLRRILYDKNTNKRVVWQFNDDKGGWTSIDSNELMVKLIQLPTGQTVQHQRGQWLYDIAKIDDTHATQTNTNTKKVRQYKMIQINKDDMDVGWTSHAQTNNQNYHAGYQNTTSRNQNYQFSNRFGGLFASLAANNDVDEDKPKEIIKLDPNDIQDIIMGDDIDGIIENDNTNVDDENVNENDVNTNNNNNKNQKKKSRLRLLFVKKKNKNNKNEVVDDGDGDGDNDEKKETNKSERVLMSDDDRNIYNEFSKTLTKDSVSIISIQKIKENASKSIVYKALLTAKKEELVDKNGVDIDKIERVLFHGTSFSNIAKIVNNGFNRDFNRHHLYGKGTYFSSLASESAKYCEADDEEDNEKYVMLVCRVIIGEYTVGSRDMDGSSIPYKPDKKTQYESCVNNAHSPTIFVINRDYHAIPTHIIKFKYKK